MPEGRPVRRMRPGHRVVNLINANLYIFFDMFYFFHRPPTVIFPLMIPDLFRIRYLCTSCMPLAVRLEWNSDVAETSKTRVSAALGLVRWNTCLKPGMTAKYKG